MQQMIKGVIHPFPPLLHQILKWITVLWREWLTMLLPQVHTALS